MEEVCTAPVATYQGEYQLPEFPGREVIDEALQNADKRNKKAKKPSQPAKVTPTTRIATALDQRTSNNDFQSQLPALVRTQYAEEEARNEPKKVYNLPPWDRCVDMEVYGSKEKKRGHADYTNRKLNRFAQSLSKFRLLSKHLKGDKEKSRYFPRRSSS